MVMVSNDFNNSIKNVSNREIKGYVELEYQTLNDRKQYYYAFSNNESEFSNISQILDNDKVKNNYLSLEENYFSLEESFFLPNYSNELKVGYISDDILEPIYLDGENRVSITIAPNQDMNDVVIDSTNCIPNQLTVYFKNGHPLAISTKITYTDNTVEWKEFSNIDSETVVLDFASSEKFIKEVSILLYAWSTRSRARVQQIDFGLSEVYKDRDLINFDLIEQVSKLVEEVPANELNVTLNNIDNRFNPINPDGLVKYLTENLTVKSFLGVVTESNGIEYASCGIFNLKDWKNNGDSTTTLICRNIIDKVQSQEFENSTGGFFKIGLDEASYKNYLKNNYPFSFIFNWTKYKSSNTQYTKYEKLVDFLSESTLRCQSILRGNRNNQVEIKAIDKNVKDVLSRNELLNEPKYTVINRVSQVNIIRPYYTAATSQVESGEILNTTVTLSKTTQIFRFISTFDLGGNLSVTQSGGTSVSVIDKGVFEIFIKVTGNVGSSVRIIVSGTKTTMNETEIVDKFYDSVLSNDNKFSFKSNLNAGYSVDAIAQHILDNDSTYSISLEYSGNPAHEAGDMITVPTKFGNKDIFIEKLTLKYDGGLSGTIEGVGN